MKNITIISSLLLVLASCGNTSNRIKEKAEDLKDKVTGNTDDDAVPAPSPEQLKLNYATPFVNRHSQFLIIPTQLETISGKGEDVNLYSNLIFFNPEDGQVNSLDSNYIGFIEKFKVLTSQPNPTADDDLEYKSGASEYLFIGKNAPNSLLFLEVANSKLETDKSSNIWNSLYKRGDTGYNRYLAVVGDDGKNFTPLTPANSTAIWWEFIQNGSGFIASAVVDSDNNGKIEDSDKIELFYTNLQKPELGRTIIPTALQQTLTSDYIKRKKEFEQKSN